MAEEDGLDVLAESHDNESIPTASCEGHQDRPAADHSVVKTICECLPDLLEAGVAERRNGNVVLTGKGSKRAEQLIRSHRLAEALLSQAMNIDVEAEQDTICQLEHALSPAVADHICAFLGHPPTCPHGRPIPRGRCCQKVTRDISPLVVPLSDAVVGKSYRITFITSGRNGRLDRLAVLGITPDTEMWLHQKRPSYVLRVGETDVAVDKDIARDIYVCPA